MRRSKRYLYNVVIFLISTSNLMAVNFQDGQLHTILDTTYANENISLDDRDYRYSEEPVTKLEIIEGGVIKSLTAECDSIAFLNGGEITGGVGITDAAFFTLVDGTVGGGFNASRYSSTLIDGGVICGSFLARNDSSVIIQSGTIKGLLKASDRSSITICGGNILDRIESEYNAMIYLDGSGFEINGQKLSYGDSLKSFANNPGNPFFAVGNITGTLADGSDLDNEFLITLASSTGDIIIIPEPLTIILVGFGSLFIRTKNSI